MARQKRKVRGSPGGMSGGFAGIPRVVVESSDFKALSYSAKALLMLLAYQYRGKNNGDLTVAHSYLKQWGFGSRVTITKAVTKLIAARMIIRTREGRFQNPSSMCALYALTWQSIDECGGKIEVSATTLPPRKFSLEAPQQKAVYRK